MKNILEEANDLIYGERRKQYGHARVAFDRIAKVWSGILGTDVTGEQVGLCMAGMKLVRADLRWCMDDLVDAAGYIGCVEQVRCDPREHAVPDPKVEDGPAFDGLPGPLLPGEPVRREPETWGQAFGSKSFKPL